MLPREGRREGLSVRLPLVRRCFFLLFLSDGLVLRKKSVHYLLKRPRDMKNNSWFSAHLERISLVL